MNYPVTLCFVLMAAYGLANLLLSIVVAGIWCAWLESKTLTSRSLLALRLLPGQGALFLTLTVVLPAFLVHEPTRTAEPVGPMLMLMAGSALICIGAGFLRGWRAWSLAAALLRNCGPRNQRCLMAGQPVDVIDVPDAMVAVVGVWRPRIVAATGVLAVCSREEFRAVIDHEAAHISAHDNLKLLLLVANPDMLAWMPAGKALAARWRAQVEFEADAIATGADCRKRVALASALIKVARVSAVSRQETELSMRIATDDIEGRVRRLLTPLPTATRPLSREVTVACALLIVVAAVPLYGPVQELIESLVAFGR